MSRNPIERCIRDSLDTYYRDLDGENPSNVYDMVLQAVERPLLETVMAWASNNQSQAADYLGINSTGCCDLAEIAFRLRTDFLSDGIARCHFRPPAFPP